MAVEIVGAKETAKALERRLELQNVYRRAARTVAADAAGRVPQRSGRAAASVRGGATAKYAYVGGGKQTVPYFGWLDFGSRTPRKGQSRAVGPWAKSGAGPPKGRFLYPAIDAHQGQFLADIADEAVRIATK